MGALGWALVTLGVVSLVIGLAQGAKDLFTKVNEGGQQAALPTQAVQAIIKLLDAPPAKFFTIVGLILIVVGLALNGVEVFGSDSKGDSAAALASFVSQ